MPLHASGFGVGAFYFWLDVYTEQVLGLDYFLMPVLQSFSHMVCFDDAAML